MILDESIEPTEADHVAMLAAIGDVRLPKAVKAKLLDGLWRIHAFSEVERSMERFDDRKARLRERAALKSALSRALEVLSDEVARYSLMHGMYAEPDEAHDEIKDFMWRARRMLEAVKQFEPLPSRTKRGEEQFRTYLQRQQDFRLVELLESVDLRVGATGGAGGPGSRLMARLRAWLQRPDQAAHVQSPDSAKRVIRLRR